MISGNHVYHRPRPVRLALLQYAELSGGQLVRAALAVLGQVAADDDDVRSLGDHPREGRLEDGAALGQELDAPGEVAIAGEAWPARRDIEEVQVGEDGDPRDGESGGRRNRAFGARRAAPCERESRPRDKEPQ